MYISYFEIKYEGNIFTNKLKVFINAVFVVHESSQESKRFACRQVSNEGTAFASPTHDQGIRGSRNKIRVPDRVVLSLQLGEEVEVDTLTSFGYSQEPEKS